MTNPQEWYDNKQLFELIQGLQTDIINLKLEMQHTTMLLKSYNGLRERLDACEQSIAGATGKSQGSQAMWGYVVGGIGLLLALISYAVR